MDFCKTYKWLSNMQSLMQQCASTYLKKQNISYIFYTQICTSKNYNLSFCSTIIIKGLNLRYIRHFLLMLKTIISIFIHLFRITDELAVFYEYSKTSTMKDNFS